MSLLAYLHSMDICIQWHLTQDKLEHYQHFCPTGFPHQMMFMSFISNTTDATIGPGTSYPSEEPDIISVFEWDSCCSIFSFLSCFLDHCFNFCPISFVHCIVCPSIDGFRVTFGIFTLFLLYHKKNNDSMNILD